MKLLPSIMFLKRQGTDKREPDFYKHNYINLSFRMRF